MAELPSGSTLINAQFWEAPDGTWWEYLNSTKRFVQRPTIVDLESSVASSTSRMSAIVVPTVNSSTATIPETIGKFIHFVVVNREPYRIKSGGVTFNSSTGVFDFSAVGITFYGGDEVWAEYSGNTGGVTPDGGYPSYPTFTALQADSPRADNIYHAQVDDSPNGDGTESFFISFQNRLFYQVLIEQ